MNFRCVKYIALFLFTGWYVDGSAQDVPYSQFFANQLDLNPAFAGSQYYHRVTANYRNQWPGLGVPFVTYSISYDRHLGKSNSGIGIQVEQDRQMKGALQSTTFTGIYSYLVKLNEEAGIRFGIGAAVIQNNIDLNKLTFPDMIDPIYGPIYPHNSSDDPAKKSRIAADFSVGVVSFFDKYHFGGSVQHLSEPVVGFTDESNLPMKFTLHAGAEFPVTRYGLRHIYCTLNPLFMFQKQGSYTQINYGGFADINSFVMGTWFRQNVGKPSSMIYMFGYDTKTFRIAYSFDWTFSKLDNVGNGTHEVSLIFLMGEREYRGRKKPIPCPKFFRKSEINVGGQRDVF